MTAARPASEPPWSSQAPERSAPPPDGLASRPAEISPAWEGGEEKQSSATAEHPPAPRYGPRIRFGRAPRGGRMGVVWRTRAAREGIRASRSRGARSALPMAPCRGGQRCRSQARRWLLLHRRHFAWQTARQTSLAGGADPWKESCCNPATARWHPPAKSRIRRCAGARKRLHLPRASEFHGFRKK